MTILNHISGKKLIAFDKRNPAERPYIEELYDSDTDWVVLKGHDLRLPLIKAGFDNRRWFPNKDWVLSGDSNETVYPYIAFVIDTQTILKDILGS